MNLWSRERETSLPAVRAFEACKRYTRKNGTTVLSGFNMTVERGTIYSLLGASGCGKTTVLQCCVGLNSLDCGAISVFGETPGSEASGIPGKRVGYMPQDFSLYDEFTIRESLEYFGRIYGMARNAISERMGFFMKLVDLSDPSRRISTLSGGHKRKVSFVVALIHNPELLILDEPTVGVDPLIRQSVWSHLRDLVSTKRTTVIITTHHIEEARKSDMVKKFTNIIHTKSLTLFPHHLYPIPVLLSRLALMRYGRLLTENSPENLMLEHSSLLLEDIVLKLCLSDDRDISISRSNAERLNALELNAAKQEREIINENILTFGKRNFGLENTELDDDEKCIGLKYFQSHSNDLFKKTHVVPLPDRKINKGFKSTKEFQLQKSVDEFKLFVSKISALTMKNYLALMRNYGFLLFVFCVPALQIFLICLAIGNDPTHLRIGVVNHDIEGVCGLVSEECVSSSLSCRYLDLLPKDKITLDFYTSDREALVEVQRGPSWGFVSFPANYSAYIMDRVITGNFASNDTIENSNIKFRLDMSSRQIGQGLKKIFFDAFQKYMASMLASCGYDPRSGELPITFESPIYGTDDTNFREYLAPSVLLGLLFFFPMCSSGISYITEKKTGTLQRSLVAGITTSEIMLSYVLTNSVVLIGQSAFAFIILTFVFHIEIQGSVMLAVLLSLLIGLGGLSMGFLVSTFCTEEVDAVLLAIGSFFPNFLLAGIVWPTQGMPMTLQYVSYLLPCTLACESMRSIIGRGWGITHPSVWPGFASTIIWILFYWALNFYIHRSSSRRFKK